MSEREEGDRRKRSRSSSRDRERHSSRPAGQKKRSSSDRKHRSRSRSRSHSPDSRKHSHSQLHRNDDKGERHSSHKHKKHKRHRDDRDGRSRKHSSTRRRSHSPSVSSVSSSSPSSDRSRAGSQPTLPSPAFPSTASLEAARSILTALLTLDPASHDDLLFLLFQLDHRHSIIIQHIAHPQARQYLQQLVHVFGLQQTTEEGGEEGWRVWDSWSERKLLPELESVFEAARKGERKDSTEAAETKADNAPAAQQNDTSHPTALIGPALPPPSYRPSTAAQQQLTQQATVAHDEHDVEEEDGAAEYGPRLASQLTADETAALEQMQRARQHLKDTQQHIQQLRTNTHPTDTTAASPLAHEEWMTVVPAAMSSQTALMASMAGDRAMKGRAFAMRGGGSGGERDSSGWTAGPQEREWKRTEREAEKQVEKALAHLRAVQQRLHNKAVTASAHSSDVSAGRTSAAVSSVSSAELSLLNLHQQRLKAEQSSVARERGAPLFWDRDKEMGMRRQKTDQQIGSELRGATQLNSRFALSGS